MVGGVGAMQLNYLETIMIAIISEWIGKSDDDSSCMCGTREKMILPFRKESN